MGAIPVSCICSKLSVCMCQEGIIIVILSVHKLCYHVSFAINLVCMFVCLNWGIIELLLGFQDLYYVDFTEKVLFRSYLLVIIFF